MAQPETIYGYTMQHGDKYVFYRGTLIVINPRREPWAIEPNGVIEALPLWCPGERKKSSIDVDKIISGMQ